MEDIVDVDFQPSDLKVLRYDGFGSKLLLTGLTLTFVVGLVLKGLIIHYLLTKAPKERPLNTLMLVDQVINF